MFQAFAVPAEKQEIRQFLMETATEELGHIEMLATAVAKNLEGASEDARESAREDPIIDEMMRTGQPRQALSAGLHAMPVDSNGVPFTGNYVVASGNLAADLPTCTRTSWPNPRDACSPPGCTSSQTIPV